jgi:hypothetical protein
MHRHQLHNLSHQRQHQLQLQLQQLQAVANALFSHSMIQIPLQTAKRCSAKWTNYSAMFQPSRAALLQ